MKPPPHRLRPLVFVIGAVLLTACTASGPSANPEPGPPSSAPASPTATATATSTPSSAVTTPPPTPRYSAVELTLIDDVTGYPDDNYDDGCVPYRLRKGTKAQLVDDDGKVVGRGKTGSARELDEEGNCGASIKFGAFSSASETFTLKIGGLTLEYSDDDLRGSGVETLPDTWSKSEKSYLRWYEREYGDSEDDEDAGSSIARGYGTCEQILDYKNRREQLEYMIEVSELTDGSAQAATRYLCPKGKGIVAEARQGFSDGTYDVGPEVRPGTYRTAKKTRDCYWSRTNSGGSILANDFVSYAPQGVTVTIYSSDAGFESEGCTAWVRLR